VELKRRAKNAAAAHMNSKVQKGSCRTSPFCFSGDSCEIADLGKVSASARGARKLEPTKVQIVSDTDSVFAVVKNSLTPVKVQSANLP
jgi:hypothetical protein